MYATKKHVFQNHALLVQGQPTQFEWDCSYHPFLIFYLQEFQTKSQTIQVHSTDLWTSNHLQTQKHGNLLNLELLNGTQKHMVHKALLQNCYIHDYKSTYTLPLLGHPLSVSRKRQNEYMKNNDKKGRKQNKTKQTAKGRRAKIFQSSHTVPTLTASSSQHPDLWHHIPIRDWEN